MKLSELQKQIFEINKANGWHDKVPSKLEQHALFHTEITEAYEQFVDGKYNTWYQPDGKPEGFYTELADVVIRILDYFSLCEYQMPERYAEINNFDKKIMFKRVSEFLLILHSEVSRATEKIRIDNLFSSEKDALLLIIVYIDYYLHHRYQQSLTDLITEKIAYNKTRGYRYGGKVI